MTKRVLLLIIILALALAAGLAVNSARAFRERVHDDPRANQPVTTTTPTGDKEEMTWATAVLKRAARRQTNAAIYWLINEPVSFLWATVYGFAGLSGGCIFLLILVVDPSIVRRQPADVDREFEAGRFLARLAVATTAGVLAYFVTILPASAAILPLKSIGARSSDVYGSLLLLPTASGIFISNFFGKLPVWLDNVLAAKQKNKEREADRNNEREKGQDGKENPKP